MSEVSGGGRNWRRALEHATFAFAPVVVTVVVFITVWARDGRGEDFRLQYWRAGWLTLHGLTPYVWSHGPVGFRFPYPAFTALFFVPFGLLPRALSGDLFTAVCLAAPLVTLKVLNVRDWRLYGLVLLLDPVVAGWQTSNLTLLLGLGIALLWKYRERPLVAGALVAILISLKPLVWPIALWLLVTRRWKAAAYAAVFGAVIQVVSWSVLGFNQVSRFLHLSLLDAHTFAKSGYGIAASLMNAGVSQAAATAAAVVVSAALVGSCMYAGRRRGGVPALVLTIALTFCASPLVWTHYFALLIVPLAIARPKLSPVWGIPVVLWVCPLGTPVLWERALAVTTVVVMIVLLLVPNDQRPELLTRVERQWKRAIAAVTPGRSVPSAPGL